MQLSIKEAKLTGAVEDRDRARADLKDANGLARDEIIKKAWEARDGAVARKNETEISLARSRIELNRMHSDLMEAIQQKVELSQQLEQWQVRTVHHTRRIVYSRQIRFVNLQLIQRLGVNRSILTC